MIRNTAQSPAVQSPTRSAPSGALLVLIAAVLWSTTAIAGQLLPAVPPPTIGALRLVLGAAVLALLALVPSQRTGDWSRLDRSGRHLVLIAGFCTALFQVCFFGAVRLTGAAVGPLAVLASAPAWAALIEWLVKRERPVKRWYLGTALAVAGVGVLSIAGHEISVQIWGLISAVIAGACYAGYSNTTRMLGQRGAGRTWVVRTSLAVGAVLICPLLFFADFEPLANTRSLWIVGWLAVAGTALPYLAFVAGLRYAPARTAATLGLAQPLTGTVLAVIVLHETVTPMLWVAAALLISGLTVVSLPGRPTRPAVVPSRTTALTVPRDMTKTEVSS